METTFDYLRTDATLPGTRILEIILCFRARKALSRRAFYDIERLRKSARPLTPAEFDAELKAALTAKTRAARAKSSKGKPAAAAPKKAARKKAAKVTRKVEPIAKKSTAKKKLATKKAR
jgi:ribosome-associated protein